MEIKELRVGNLLDRNGIMEVLGIGANNKLIIYDHYNKERLPYGLDVDSFKPIELSPEWLTRLGFVWNPECNSWEKYPNGDARMHLKFYDVNASYTMFNHVLKATIAERIWFVHQLQNLFYSLTGEELAIDKNLSQKLRV